MAIKQIVPIYITLLGDAAATTFVFPVQNLFQQGFGGSVPFGVTGSIPSSASANNPPYPVTSVAVDANGNITITFTSAPPAVEFQLELDITFNSGSATSSTPTVSQNVTLTGTSTVTISGTAAVNLTQLNGVALGSPSNYGTSPGAVSVQGVNAFITNTVPVTLTSTTITGTVAVTQSTSPWVVSLTSTTITGTVAVTQSTSPWTVQGDSASGAANAGNPVKIGGVFNTTQPTVTNGQTVDAQFTARGAQIVAVGVDGFAVTVGGTVAVTQSTSPWVVSLTSTTITGTVAVTQSTSPWVVSGNLTHNNAAPTTNNVGVLPAVASTAAPTYTTGDQVLLSTDLAGNLRVTFAAASEQNVNLNQWAGTNLGTPTAYGTSPGAVVAGSVNAFVTNTVATTLASTTITGTVAVTQSTSPWVDNLTQVAGVALGATGVAAFGTAPSAANVMGVNASLFAGGAGLTPATFGTTAAGTGLLTNASLFIGTTVAVAASAGVQKVGISGATGGTLDAAQNAAAPANELVVGAVFNTTTPALTAGNASQLQSDSTGSLQVNTEGKKQSYRCGIISFGPLASSSPTISVTGSATKTIRITRIRLSVAATAGAICDVSLKRFSTLTGGTSASQSANIAKLDTNNAAATAVVNLYTAAATTATAAGVLAAERYEIVTASVSVAPQAIEWDFSNMNAQACVLRGTGDFVGFLFSAIGTTPNGDCWIEWTEE